MPDAEAVIDICRLHPPLQCRMHVMLPHMLTSGEPVQALMWGQAIQRDQKMLSWRASCVLEGSQVETLE